MHGTLSILTTFIRRISSASWSGQRVLVARPTEWNEKYSVSGSAPTRSPFSSKGEVLQFGPEGSGERQSTLKTERNSGEAYVVSGESFS